MNSLQNDVQNFSQTLGELKVLMKNNMAGKRSDEDRFKGSVLITQLKNFNAQGITKNTFSKNFGKLGLNQRATTLKTLEKRA